MSSQKPLHKSASFAVKSPLKTHNATAKSLERTNSSWNRPRVSLKKSASVSARHVTDNASCGKRVRSEQENDSNDSSSLASEGGSSGKRPAALNPFARSISLGAQAEVLLEPFNLNKALTSVFASSLVDDLHAYREQISHKNAEEAGEGHSQLEDTQKTIMEKKAFVPYKDYFDWSLKTKLCMRTREIPHFLANLTAEDRINVSRPIKAKGVSKGTKFLQLLRYWMFPVLSGTSTFPRTLDPSTADQASANWAKMMPSLYDDWETSILELLDLIEFGVCPYFYIVTHQWKALILGKETNSESVERAYISPTTIGFRNMLRENGFDLQMPLRPTTETPDSQLEDLDTSSGSDGSFTSMNWIKEQCKRVGKIVKVVNTDQQEQILDNRPESLISLRDKEVSEFIHTLVKNRSLQPNGGSLTNVPPTLIAPVSFSNANLRKLDYTAGQTSSCFLVEFADGPVLPHLIPCLAGMIRGVGQPDESATFLYAPLEGTVAFAKLTKTPETQDHEVNMHLQSIKLIDIIEDQKPDGACQADDVHSVVKNLMKDFRFI